MLRNYSLTNPESLFQSERSANLDQTSPLFFFFFCLFWVLQLENVLLKNGRYGRTKPASNPVPTCSTSLPPALSV